MRLRMKFSHRLVFLSIVGCGLFIYLLLAAIGFAPSFSRSHKQKLTTFLEDNPVEFNIDDGLVKQGQCRADFSFDDKKVISTVNLGERTSFKIRGNGEYELPHQPLNEAAYSDKLKPLTVIIVPHSHVDPGWLNTVDEYYHGNVKKILTNMVRKLHTYEDFTFIWAEIVFFSRWYEDQTRPVQLQVLDLIKSGRLEIVSGGWVMPDEASTTYTSVIDQLVEGHQWVQEHLHVHPVNSWSIDPFGHSGTMPYLWRKSGMSRMVIQRIHQATKGALAMNNRSLEFFWKQYWDSTGTGSTVCHVMPYMLYSLHHTCGPDKFTCALFDFKQVPGDPVFRQIQPVSDANILKKAQMLYEQYRLKGSLYNYNTILVPLGDDFRYVHAEEWDQQYENYKKLMKYMNGRKDWKIKVKFGTVSDYFKSMKKASVRRGIELPTVSGDFFPYSDHDNAYWTGYFTTRPFDKRFSREVEMRLRAAEALNVLAQSYSKVWQVKYEYMAKTAKRLREARRDLALFLHHDAITGTGKSFVVADYEEKMYNAFQNSEQVAEVASQFLLTKGKLNGDSILQPELVRGNAMAPSMHQVITPSKEGTRVVIFNPTGQFRTEFTSCLVSTTDFEIKDSDRKVIPFQVNPIFSSNVEVTTATFEVVFLTKMPAFSIETFVFKSVYTTPQYFWAKISVYNSDQIIVAPELKFDQSRPKRRGNKYESVSIENKQIRAEFMSVSGMLKKVTDLKTNKSTMTMMEFKHYISRGSGAYIFFPAGPARDTLQGVPVLRLIEGPFCSELQVVYPMMLLKVKLYHHPGLQGRNLIIENAFDMHVVNMRDREVVMRLSTDIDNTLGSFFTDQNGFQMIGRKRHPTDTGGFQHVERNYYPITTMAFLQDKHTRLTLHTGQSHGVASLEKGQLELMIDRQLLYDDERGLGEGVFDNKMTMTKFILQVEHSDSILDEEMFAFPSLQGSLVNEYLQQPFMKMFTTINSDILSLKFTSMQYSLPCDITVVALKTLYTSKLNYNGTSLIIHRKGYRCDFPEDKLECSGATVNVEGLFPGITSNRARETTLTHLINKTGEITLDNLYMPPMDIKSYIVNIF